MFIARVNREARRAFTLLEITLAVAILAMMSLAIYRFVQTNLVALRISAEDNAVDAQYTGFASFLGSEWAALRPGSGALLGEPLKLDNKAHDEITWVCGPGPGLMTRYADGDYRVSMRLRPVAKESNEVELGLMRRANDVTGNVSDNETWVPLLSKVQSLEIHYFDPRKNEWVDKWSDSVTLPRLVKLVIGRASSAVPWEAVIPLARTPL